MGEERIARIVDGQWSDLDWLGIQPDSYIKQTNILGGIREMISDDDILVDPGGMDVKPHLIGDDYVPLYPMLTLLTLEKVFMDHQIGTTHLIRGVDLLSEYSLYQYYCLRANLPRPDHIYLPRLRWHKDSMSKTTGSISITDLRNQGLTPQDVREILEMACLHRYEKDWTLRNLKGDPCV